jgi:hypothetical protein
MMKIIPATMRSTASMREVQAGDAGAKSDMCLERSERSELVVDGLIHRCAKIEAHVAGAASPMSAEC